MSAPRRLAAQAEAVCLKLLPREEFLRYTIRSADDTLGCALLIEARANGSVEDHYRVIFYGNVAIQANFEAARMLDIPEARGVFLQYEVWPYQAQPEWDSTTLAWVDVQELLHHRVSGRPRQQ